MLNFRRKKIVLYFIIGIQANQNGFSQNSLTGDGFGGRQWYVAHNYQVGAYSAYTVCGSNNQLYGWGSNRNGELGDSTYISTTAPKAIPNMTNVKFYTTGYISGAIKNDNTGWVWGDHQSGHNTGMPPIPKQVITDVKFVDGGMTHIVFVKNDGTVWGMGSNAFGELGTGSTTFANVTTPVQMQGITNAVRAIAVSYSIRNWPNDPPQASYMNGETLILLSNGTVMRTGGGGYTQATFTMTPVIVPGLTNIVDIKGNTYGAVALDVNGKVYSFGTYANSTGLGVGNLPLSSWNTYIQPTQVIFPVNAKPIVALSSNNDGFSVLALDSSHQVFGWGNTFMGQLGVGDTTGATQYSPIYITNDVKDIFCGETFSYILKQNDSLMASGFSKWDYLPYDFGSIWMNLPNLKRFNFTNINPSIAPMNLCPPKPFGCGVPFVNLGNDTTLCPGSLLTLSAPTATNYLWSTGATSQSINVSSSGQYWVKLGSSICFSTDTINVNISAPQINLGNDSTLCQGQNITLNAGTANAYLWSTGATSQTINVSSSGQYWVKASNGNCFSTDTINISFNQPPIVNLGNDTTLCQGQTIVLNGGTASNYLWSTGATSQIINVQSSGQYWVKLTNFNCSKIDTINISFITPPNVNIGTDTTLCQGQTIILNAGTANTYIWSTGANSQTINVSSSGQFWVKANNGNCFKTDTINIFYKYPPAFLFPTDTTLCNNEILVLNAGNALNYLWSNGETTPIINVNQSGVYNVNLGYYATCKKQFSITAKFESCECNLFMPNIFTPNNDGINDIFKPSKLSGCQFLNFSIYNRYGENVFTTFNLDNGWNGSYKGQLQENGTFVWKVTAIKDGKMKLYKGTVILIK